MLYAIRNEEGRIISLTESRQPGAEPVDMQNQDVLNFLSINDDEFNPEQYLGDSDAATVRIIEDILDVLMSKDLVLFTDLPDASQKKLLSRKLARKMISGEEEIPDGPGNFLLSDDERLL